MNSELQSVQMWCQQNSLFLNAAKSHAILFPYNRNPILTPLPSLSINNNVIKHETETDFLGITICNNLSWKKHIQKISKKVSQGLYALSSTKHILPKTHRKLIYNALIESHLTYGITLWGHTYKSHLRQIATQQKKSLRFISNTTYNAHTDPLFESSKILKLNDLIKLHTLLYMHRIIRNSAPPEIAKLFPNRNQTSIMETRQPNIQIPRFNKSSHQNSILFQGPKLLTYLPQFIKNKLQFSSSALKKNYKQHLLSLYRAEHRQ